MPQLRIPESFLPAWKAFASLDEEGLARVTLAIRGARPSLRVQVFLQQAAQAMPVDVAVQRPLLEMLLNLAVLRIEVPRPTEALLADLRGYVDTLGPDFAPRTNWETLGATLGQIIAAPALVLTAKAEDVMSQHQHVLTSARAFTDVRPVFSDDVAQGPVGGVVVHTLRLEYYDGESEKSFYLAMDNEDVQSLLDVLDRARLKGDAVQTGIRSGRFQMLGDGT